MGNKKDISGQRFTRLTAISYSHSNKYHMSYWLCRCDCGNEVTVRICELTRTDDRRRQSCGCLNRERIKAAMQLKRLPYETLRINALYAKYKSSAETRNLEFTLTKKQVLRLIDGFCIYCGESRTSHMAKNGQSDTVFYYTGIDRIDNSKGYITGNVQSCCKICNRAKSDMDEGDFIEHFMYKFGWVGIQMNTSITDVIH